MAQYLPYPAQLASAELAWKMINDHYHHGSVCSVMLVRRQHIHGQRMWPRIM